MRKFEEIRILYRYDELRSWLRLLGYFILSLFLTFILEAPTPSTLIWKLDTLGKLMILLMCNILGIPLLWVFPFPPWVIYVIVLCWVGMWFSERKYDVKE